MIRILCWGIAVVQSNGYPWNGWVSRLKLDGEPEDFWEFRAGAYWEALQHLEECSACLAENGLDIREVRERLREIEEEWEKATDP